MNLITLISEVLELNADQISDKTGRAACPEWTSMKHVELMVALEELYDVDFTSYEMATVTDVGRLQALLAAKIVAVTLPTETGIRR